MSRIIRLLVLIAVVLSACTSPTPAPGAGMGARQLFPGRNASLPKGDGWDVAMWAEGWTTGAYAPDADGNAKRLDGVDYKIMVDPAAQQVTVRIPLSVFGDHFDYDADTGRSVE